jgi:hypothetical protein
MRDMKDPRMKDLSLYFSHYFPAGDTNLKMVLIFLLLCSGSRTPAQSTNHFFQFVQEQSGRHYSRIPREVLAAYYAWYGPGQGGWKDADTNTHTIGNTAHYPVKGPYSSHDPALLDWQIEQAKAHGITGFVVSWFGLGPDATWINESLALLLERAEKKNFKVSVYWEQAPGGGQDQLNRAVGELAYLLKRYATSNAFLKVDAKPVVFAYGRVLAQVPMAAWPELIRRTRAEAGDFVILADGFLESYAYLFDGLHTYGGPKATDEERRAVYARLYGEGVALARRHGRISCVAVGAGYDDRKQNKPGWWADRQDGKVYRTLWEEAIQANPDWVLISTWNEWPEGTEIEPSLELGDHYLKLTSEYASRFQRLPASPETPRVSPPRLAPGQVDPLDRLLAKRTVGVLPGSNPEPQFWFAYCGAVVRPLNWPDLTDPTLFNARHLPLLLHAANDHFTSSVKTTDDITRALIQYHRQGGFLVVLPNAPWPFLYDDSRHGQPAAISDTLGLGVTGWEETPPEVKLTFHAKTNVLFGINGSALFPGTGDRRFTPSSRGRVPAQDTYVPLVQLKDHTGRVQGDAVVYIEHRTPQLSPGKAVYAWMRVPAAFGEQDFLLSLYHFIATRLPR